LAAISPGNQTVQLWLFTSNCI